MYRVSDFAEKAGVTVRTLHHYDRLGLLKPSGRTGAGYRLYGERDLARLQQIVTLKFIGLPLRQIKDLLDRSDLDLAATLRLQRRMLLEKRQQVEPGDKGPLYFVGAHLIRTDLAMQVIALALQRTISLNHFWQYGVA